jgi:hypothetical protein
MKDEHVEESKADTLYEIVEDASHGSRLVIVEDPTTTKDIMKDKEQFVIVDETKDDAKNVNKDPTEIILKKLAALEDSPLFMECASKIYDVLNYFESLNTALS